MSLRMLIAILNLKHLMLDIVTVGIFRLSMLEPPGTIGLVSTQYIRETNKSIEIFGNGQVSLRTTVGMEQWIPQLDVSTGGHQVGGCSTCAVRGAEREVATSPSGWASPNSKNAQFLSDAKMRGRDFFGNTKSYQRSDGVKSSIF